MIPNVDRLEYGAPHNTEAEIALIGALLFDTAAFSQIGDLEPEHFYHNNHQLIFTAIKDLAARSQPTDLVFVTNYLREKTWLKTVGGKTALAKICQQCVTSINVAAYAVEVKAHWERRELIRQGEELIAQAQNTCVSLDVSECQAVPGASHSLKSSTVKNTSSRVACGATFKEINDFEQTDAAGNIYFYPERILPGELARKLIKDGEKQNIDPVGIWQYLMTVTLSLMGQDTIVDFSGFVVPNILWGIIVQRSGAGKTRAQNLVTSPLSAWQEQAFEEFKEQIKIWKDSQKGKYRERGGDETLSVTDDTDTPPKLRKYLFNVATPQAIVRRLSEQENGCIWVRDELKGLFKSLDQFSGEGEGMEILLESWDGKGCAVDRVDIENTYYIPSSRLSVAGGIQPGVFSKVFSDPDDAQGTQARCLFAIPREIPVKRVKGYCELSDTLPTLYKWIEYQNWGRLTPTEQADDLFTVILETFGNEPCLNEATKAWMSKLGGQTLRVAMAIHALDCYYDRSRDIHKIQYDTLYRAYELALYYKACFRKLQGFVSENIPGILLKIQKKAENLGKAAMADLYRNVRPIRNLAKEENVGIAEFTLTLCRQLESLGKGKVISERDTYYYLPNIAPHATRDAETLTQQGLEVCGSGDTRSDTATRSGKVTLIDLPDDEERF